MKELYKETRKTITRKYLKANNSKGQYLLSADIAKATLQDRSEVYITWGLNLDKKEQKFFFKELGLKSAHVSAWEGHAEIIIPDATAKKLLKNKLFSELGA